MARETVQCIATSTASADDIWAVAQDFTAPWHPMVDWMELEPRADSRIIRRFATKGDDTIYREELTYVSQSDHVIAYRALEGIAGVHAYHARLRISEAAGETTLTWHAKIEAAANRAKEIAQGTGVIFEAGLVALANVSKSAPSPVSLPTATSISTLSIGNTPSLGLTVAPRGLTQTKTLCLYLHGIGGNRTNWNAQLRALGRLMPMASLDLRGYGDSTLGFAQSQLDDYFDDILAVMAHFGADRLVLCGLSYGAWIAASFALRHPDKIAGLVLCGGCTGMSEADPDEREAFRVSRAVPLDAGQTPADFAIAVVNVIAGPDASEQVHQQLTASMAAIPAETYRDALTCFTNPLERLDFRKANFPILLMTGAHDLLAPADEIRAVSQRFAAAGAPYVRFEVISGAGHVCNLEQPEQVNGYLAAFFRFLLPAAPDTLPKTAKRAKKRERILDAALKEFSENGYSGASMQRIADRAEVSKPTLYQYIGQKEDVFRAILDQGRDAILAPLEQAADQDMVSVLWRFAQSYASYVLHPETLAISRLMIGEAARVPQIVRQYHDNGPARALGGIAAYLKGQSKSGNLILDDPQLAAEHLWSLILSGPRNDALHFPGDVVDPAVIQRSIHAGLRVFLTAYSVDPKSAVAALNALTA